MRLIAILLSAGIILGCASTKPADYSELLNQVTQILNEESSDSVQPPPSPTVESPKQGISEVVEEEQSEKKPNSDRVVVGHNYTCVVGRVDRGASVLKFTGSRGGLEVLKSNTTGELKMGLPWNYSSSLTRDVKACYNEKCQDAQNDKTEHVNFDAVAEPLCAERDARERCIRRYSGYCTQWIRWGMSPQQVFRKIGAPITGIGVYFLVDNNRVNLCRKQWRREGRCS